MTAGERSAVALARTLLMLYPPAVRRDVGAAVIADVRRRARELGSANLRLLAWLVRLGGSLVANACGAWIEAANLRSGSAIVSSLDLKLAVRMLVRFPGLTIAAGLGIAVAVAIGVSFFALFYERFYPAIPLPGGDRLVGLENWDRRTGREDRRALYDFDVWRAEMKSVEDITAFRTVDRNLISADGSAEVVKVAEMTSAGFRLARVPALLGRTLDDRDGVPEAPPAAVIGFDLWRARFDSAPDIVGRTLQLGRTAHAIVGVMPEGFAFPVNHRLWVPFRAGSSEFEPGKGPSIFVAGRLAPGFELDGANVEVAVIGHRLAAAFPRSHGDLRPEVLPYTYPFAGMSRSSAGGFWPMTVLASLLLVVVCVNVAVLVYARTATRLGEIAVRTALGASRARIVTQLFAESFILSAGAAAVGLGVVTLGLDWARASVTELGQSSFWARYAINGTVFVYFASLAALAAVITGVVPALRVTGRRVQSDLRQFYSGASLRMGRTWTTLIVAQVAVASAALPVAVSMGWFEIRDIFNLPKFPVEQILFAEISVDRERSADFGRLQAALARALDTEPGVAAHSFTLHLPNIGRAARIAIEHDAAGAGAIRTVQPSTVDARFFRTFDVSVLAGRPFRANDLDAAAADVVIVNRAFARRVLGDGDPLGRRVRFVSLLSQDDARQDETPRWHEIVGVVENIDANPFDRDLVSARVYLPMKNAERSGASVAVRIAQADRGALARKLPAMAAALDPGLRIDVVPLEEVYRLQRQGLTAAAAGLGVGLLSVILLSAAGIYALMSFTIVQRRREIAIRTALGAQPRRLLGGIFGRALRQIAFGVAIGVGAALLIDASADGEALRGRAGLLLSVTVVVIGLVGVCAALGPARRGLRIQPSEALKAEHS